MLQPLLGLLFIKPIRLQLDSLLTWPGGQLAISPVSERALFFTAQPYPFCCGLGRGDRANSVQKQSHFKSRTYVSHSSKKLLKTCTCKNCCSQTVSEYPQLFLGSCGAERPLHAPPPLRTGHVNKAQNGRNCCCRCHWLIQLLHKPLLQHTESASVCWVWRGHFDPIHVRNVMGVQ